jgi:hypothetical protein
MASITFYPTPSDEGNGLWFPDSSGIKTFTENQYVAAIADRNSYLDALTTTLEQLNTDLQAPLVGTPPTQTALTGLHAEYVPGAFVASTTPTRPTVPNDFASAPADAVIGSVANFVIDPVPVLTAVQPNINAITAPTPFSGVAPTDLALPDRTYPNAPAYNIPLEPDVIPLNLPSAPNINIADFTGILPQSITLPSTINFNWTEVEYQSVLDSELKDKLLDLVTNPMQTGLKQSDLQQTWDQGREKTWATTQGLIDNVSIQFARSGWNLLQGEEAEQILKYQENQAAQDIAENRNIKEIQAKLIQSNFQYSFKQAVEFQGLWMNLWSSMQQRSLEAAKYAVEALISLYGVLVAKLNADVALYTAQATVYKTIIEAELAKIEVYKAELEGQKLIGDLNMQAVERYKAMIQAVVALFDLYKTEIEAVKAQIEGDGLKVQQFEANIKAFAATIQAKALEYQGYESQLKGEELKVNMYKAFVEAFSAEVDAFSKGTDAKVKQLDASIKINIDTPLKELEINTEVYKSRIQAKATEITSIIETYKTDAQVFGALNEAEKTRIEAGVSLMQIDFQEAKANLDASIEVFKANMSKVLAQNELLISTLADEAKLKGSVAAAIGGAIGAHASISGSSSYLNAAPTMVTV